MPVIFVHAFTFKARLIAQSCGTKNHGPKQLKTGRNIQLLSRLNI
jgi:hypothetical protein